MALTFWFEFASTYSYPAAMRIAVAAAEAGVTLKWRPFLLGPIFAAQGWNDSPFNIYPAKGAYMWRDLKRLCDDLGLSFHRPAIFPQNGLNAARIAFVGQDAAWGPEFVRRVYAANFAEGRDISDFAVLGGILTAIGQDAATTIAHSREDAVKLGFRKQNEDAVARGIFGAPSFTVGDELFWGNDRLESALRWAKR